MKIRFKLIVLLLYFTGSVFTQSTLDQLLDQVQNNNKSLQAEKYRIAASKAFFQTGLSINDPAVNLDWMRGFPSSAGNQTDLTIAQAFDYPTSYKFRRQVAALKTEQTDFEYNLLRRNVLLESKLIALHLIYLNKQKLELVNRQAEAERFLANYQKKLEQQEVTVLDVNKARLRLVNLQTDLQLLESDVTNNLQKLSGLNGGSPVVFKDTIYPQLPTFPGFETLEKIIEENDPILNYLQKQRQIGDADFNLTKALLLPKFEAGYRYQGILGQQFHGIHTGVTIPLWENKKRLNFADSQRKAYDSQIEEHRIDHFHEMKRLYERQIAYRQNLEDYRVKLRLISNSTLLDKALQSGQLTVLEYFMETTLYYESIDRYMALEESLHKIAAELLKYQL